MRRPSLTERFALWLLRRRIPETLDARVLLDAHADLLTIDQLAREARERLRLAVIDAKTANLLQTDEYRGERRRR